MASNADPKPLTANSGESVGGRSNLRPWKQGQSGNSAGRPRIAQEVRTLARQHGPRAMARLVELLDSDDERVAIMAAKEVLDRAYGKVGPDTGESREDGNLTVIIRRFGEDVSSDALG